MAKTLKRYTGDRILGFIGDLPKPAIGGGCEVEMGNLFLLKFSNEVAVALHFEADMSWSDWVDSEYNTVGVFPEDASNRYSRMKVFNPVSNTTEYISLNGTQQQLTDFPSMGVFDAKTAVSAPI